jgi:hypothetical protein
MRLLLVLLVAVMLLPTSSASAKRKLCRAVSADGYSYPVRVLKGSVSCTTARSALKHYIIKFEPPKGWTCFRGHGQDVWAASCIKGNETHPSQFIRAYNPVS